MLAFFFILSCLSHGLYYFWISILLMFPPIKHFENIVYSDKPEVFFFILIPCLNEGRVIAETIRNILSLNMPNTTVLVIDDGSTDDTLEIVNKIKSRHLIVLSRTYPNARQGKGSALNWALRFLLETLKEYPDIEHTNVIIGVIDADTFIKRSLLERVAVVMINDPQVGMLQTRVRIGTLTRDYLLAVMQDMEFFCYINQMQNLREYMGTVAAAGNGQFNRLSAMEQLGEEPWSKCLLEDFDFSLRLLLRGWRTRLVQDEVIYQQGVISYKRFIKQRSRWAQGCMQCISYLLSVKNNQHLSFSGKVEVVSFLLLPWIAMLSSTAMIFSWFLIFKSYLLKSTNLITQISIYTSSEIMIVLVIILMIIYVPGTIFSLLYWRDTKENMYRCIFAGVLIPIYNLLQVPAVFLALFRQITGKSNWVKTDRI